MPHPHLERAPIVEALVDLRIEPPLSGMAELDVLARQLQQAFPERRNVVTWSGAFSVQADPPQATAKTSEPLHTGYALWSADKRHAVQVRVDGFSFSRLAPYESWAQLRSAARGSWTQYVQATQATAVTRCALRYVNRIDVPRTTEGLGTYLRTLPVLAPDLPQQMSGLFMRLVVPIPRGTAVVTEALDESGATADSVPLVLDIDVFVNRRFDPAGEEIWACLDELRETKNDIFYKSLTEAAWGRYQ